MHSCNCFKKAIFIFCELCHTSVLIMIVLHQACRFCISSTFIRNLLINNFENRSTYTKIMTKHQVCCFETVCVTDGYTIAFCLGHKTITTVCLLCAFLRARLYASAGNSDRNVSVRLSVCPSVTRRYCVKKKKASVMISSPSCSPMTLVFWRQISSPNSKGFPPNGSLKQGSVRKIQRFSSFKRQYLENGSRYGQSYY